MFKNFDFKRAINEARIRVSKVMKTYHETRTLIDKIKKQKGWEEK